MFSQIPQPARVGGRIVSLLMACIAVVIAAAPAVGQSTWIGGQTAPAPPPYLWSDPTNWVAGTVPGTGSSVVFSDPTASAASLVATRNDLVGLSLTNIAVNASATGPVSISGNGLTLTGTTGIDMTAAPLAQSLTVGLDAGQVITLGGPQTWSLHLQGTAGSAQTMTISSPIAGPANALLTFNATNFTAGSSGTVQLLAANTYAGGTVLGGPATTYVINTSTVKDAGGNIISGPFGTGNINTNSFNTAPQIRGGTTTLDNTMTWTSGFAWNAGSTGSLTLNGNIALTGTNTGQVNRTLNNLASQTITVNGSVTTSGPGETFVKTFNPQSNANGSITVNGVIQDANGLAGLVTKGGAGTVFFTNTGSTFAGLVALQNGTTEVASLADQGQPSSLGTGATTPEIRIGNVATTGTLRYVGSANLSTNRPLNLFGSGATAGNAVVDSSGTGTMTFTANLLDTGNGSKALVLTGTNTGLNTIGGVIPNANATAITSLQKTGPGTWQLTGASTYTGTTRVDGGTLLVNNAAGISTGAVTVTAATAPGGAFGTLGGAGGIAGAVTVQAGSGGGSDAVIAPGLTTGVGVATLSLNGGLTVNGTYTADVQTAPDLSDLLAVTGNLTLGTASTLNLPGTNTYAPPSANVTYTLATYTGTLSGTFTSVLNQPAGYSVVYTTPGQINLVGAPVPEPAFVLAACGVAGFAARRRSRRAAPSAVSRA
jgi:autotransporter-associated beta strand protein